MAWYDALATRAADFRPAAWEELPDLGLYMDQVITYLERQYRPLYGGEKRIITAAMINNYVKSGLVIRPKGKKYGREQLAQLMMLCGLKQALPLESLRGLIAAPDGDSLRAVYGLFCERVGDTQGEIRQSLASLSPMQCAVRGAAYQLLCEEMLCPEDADSAAKPSGA